MGSLEMKLKSRLMIGRITRDQGATDMAKVLLAHGADCIGRT